MRYIRNNNKRHREKKTTARKAAGTTRKDEQKKMDLVGVGNDQNEDNDGGEMNDIGDVADPEYDVANDGDVDRLDDRLDDETTIQLIDMQAFSYER